MTDRLFNFIAMGGYGGYIWSAYAITLFSFIGLWLFTRSNKRRSLQAIAEALQDEDRRL